MAVVPSIPESLAVMIGALEDNAPNWAANNAAWLGKLISDHKLWLADEHVEDYQAAYDGKLDSVDTREKDRGDGVNNKLQVNYAQMIIDTVVDYLTGKPIVWAVAAPKEDGVDLKVVAQYKADILKLIRTEAAQRILAEQLRQGSIAGYSVIIGWVDEKGRIDYDEFPVQECVPVYDVRGRLALLIRYYEIDDGTGTGATVKKVEVYDEKYVTYYLSDESGTSFTLDSSEAETGNPVEHRAGRIPASIFVNGTAATYVRRLKRNGTSDLGNGILSLLEAYAGAMSDKANTVDRLLDAYLKLKGVDTDEKEVMLMRKARALVLKGANSDAEFIAQDQEDKAVENYLARLKDTIHDQTQTPKLGDLAGATATEVKMKYAALDIKAGKKELYFVEAIKQLIALLTDFLNARRLVEAGIDAGEVHGILTDQTGTLAPAGVPLYSADWLSFTVNRNLPQNFKEIADIVGILAGKVPDTYLYELLWFVEDPEAALEEMQAQKKAEADLQANAALGLDGAFSRGGKADNLDDNSDDTGGQ